MADLSCLIDTTTVGKVDKHIEAEAAKQPPRPYMGMSEIGDPCPRRLWLKYHTDFREPFSGRLFRLFETGHIIEKRIVRDLRAAGYKVNRGKKSNSFSDFDGRFKGHSDGIISGLEESSKRHILEVKSASDKRFKEFMAKGMESEPKYKAQCHLYMGYAGLKRCLFVIENKNTSERRQERVQFDKGIFEILRDKAHMILDATTPPAGVSDRPDWWECRMCTLNSDQWCRRDWEVKNKVGVPF